MSKHKWPLAKLPAPIGAIFNFLRRDAWPARFIQLNDQSFLNLSWKVDLSRNISAARSNDYDKGDEKSGRSLIAGSFVEALDSNKIISKLWSDWAKPRCITCNVDMVESSLTSAIKVLESNCNGQFLVLTLDVTDMITAGILLEDICQMYNARSVILGSKRVRYSEFNKEESLDCVAKDDCRIVLWSGSLPLGVAAVVELHSLVESYSIELPSLQLALSDSEKIIATSMIDGGFHCPACNQKTPPWIKNITSDQIEWKLYGLSEDIFSLQTITELKTFIKGQDSRDDIWHELTSRLQQQLNFLEHFGFGSYCISHLLGHFSHGERIKFQLVNFLSLEISDLEIDLTRSLDCFLPDEKKVIIEALEKFTENNSNNIVIGDGDAPSRKVESLSSKNLKLNKDNTNGFYQIKGLKLEDGSEVSFMIPKGKIVAVSGPSGSGKTLLLKALSNSMRDTLFGELRLSYVFPESKKDALIATLLGLSKVIGELLSRRFEARRLGLTPDDLNPSKTRFKCLECKGNGVDKESNNEAGFYEPCSVCLGLRFLPEVLRVSYAGSDLKSILDLDLKQAYQFFNREKDISRILKSAIEIGLGDLVLGGYTSTLSFSEQQLLYFFQKVFLKRFAADVILVDSPFADLTRDHFLLVHRLLLQLTQQGKCVIIADNNPFFLESADYVIMMGIETSNLSPRRRVVIKGEGVLM